MNKPSKNSYPTKGKHLTYGKRCKIETLIKEGYSMRYIAECIGCSPSTVSREIKNHSIIQKSKSNDCLNKTTCCKRNVCGSISCKTKCKTCNRCKKYCNDYIQAFCDTLLVNKICNGCSKRNYCHYEKRFYEAEQAEKKYRETLVNRRNGFDVTAGELEHINALVSPLIRKGQSPYHIKQSLGAELTISESTLRRMINNNELDVCALDLKEAVKRRPRKKKQENEKYTPSSKSGHLYEDYIEYLETNDVSIVEMDCVEGKQTDKCAILTLHFVSFHMQLYYIMPEHTSACVIDTLDMIETALGTELFREMFPLILTDNGHEFRDIEGMEKSVTSGKRTMVFFCEPNRSDQKGACENNHKLLRCIIPKGTSIDSYSQADMVTITNHINSYCRKSLLGQSPYTLAVGTFPEDFFILLGLELILPDSVILTPALLKD